MIELKNIVKRFGKLTVVNNVSLNLWKGQCIALIGPNGCGKTTVIKSILGMVIPPFESYYAGGYRREQRRPCLTEREQRRLCGGRGTGLVYAPSGMSTYSYLRGRNQIKKTASKGGFSHSVASPTEPSPLSS